jgi:cytochrome c peroxidase
MERFIESTPKAYPVAMKRDTRLEWCDAKFHAGVRALRRLVWAFTALGSSLCTVACSEDSTSVTRLPDVAPAVAPAVDGVFSKSDLDDLNPRLLRRFKTLVALQTVRSPERVALGRLLFFEPLLSIDGTLSCNSCHPLDRYGTTATALTTGVNGKQSKRNAPSIYNASEQFRQFWDGRGSDVEDAVKGPLQNPNVMGMNETTLVKRLGEIEGYRYAFAAAYPAAGPAISLEHVAGAIAEFERGLLTPARWDRYLAGDNTVLTPKEKAGAKVFANLGCMVCHEGRLLGGSMFQKVGVIIPWENQKDRGRGDLTKNPADDMVFKVPSLRNVAQTAPYFNDGSVPTLSVAVQMMARHQLGVSLTDEETDAIVAWMGSLTGEIPVDYVRAPTLPAAKRPR